MKGGIWRDPVSSQLKSADVVGKPWDKQVVSLGEMEPSISKWTDFELGVAVLSVISSSVNL